MRIPEFASFAERGWCKLCVSLVLFLDGGEKSSKASGLSSVWKMLLPDYPLPFFACSLRVGWLCMVGFFGSKRRFFWLLDRLFFLLFFILLSLGWFSCYFETIIKIVIPKGKVGVEPVEIVVQPCVKRTGGRRTNFWADCLLLLFSALKLSASPPTSRLR